MDDYHGMRVRAWALEAAARSTVNPGHVIRIATRYAYFIEHGIDPGEGMQMAGAPERARAAGANQCPECGHETDRHTVFGCYFGHHSSNVETCRCALPNGVCTISPCTAHGDRHV